MTAVDLSVIALERAAAEAAKAGVAARVDFQQHDLGRTFPTGAFDLVSAQYLQSPVPFPRERVLQAAAGVVAPGGLLLIVEHGSAPSWSWNHDAEFAPPDELLSVLELDSECWRTERLGAPERQAVGLDGQAGVILDNVVAVRRSQG